MATRRSTRASSRAASSRGASPVEEEDITTTPSGRRVTRRAASSTPLPQVGLRTSNSYGANQLSHSSSVKAPSASEQISSILGVVLEGPEGHSEEEPSSSRAAAPEVRSRRGGRRAASSAASVDKVDRSYNLEKNIFNGAEIESSVLSEDSGVPEHPRAPAQSRESVAMQKQKKIVAEVAQSTRVARFDEQKARKLRNKKIYEWVAYGVISAFLLTLLCFATSIAFGHLHSFDNILPTSGSGQYFNTNHVTDLQKRMKIVESDIARLKKRSDMDGSTIAKLESILPSRIVCTKDANGEIQIPDDFWYAIQSKIRKYDSLFDENITGGSKETSKGGLSKREVTNIVAKAIEESESGWQKFLINNEEKITQWSSDDYAANVEESMRKYSETHQVVRQKDFIEAIKKNWHDTQKEVQNHLGPITKRIDEYLRKLQQVDQKILTREKVATIANDVARKMIANAQLGAQSKANIHTNANEALLRVNHFSRGTGAVVDPTLSSPNFVFPSMDQGVMTRGLAWLAGRPIPLPKPPQIALEKWEEHGDCWCSPSKGADGFGQSLGVITGNQIQPDQVVVEHIASSAALEPGAAPKDMELLAFINDIPTYHAVRQKSDLFFDTANEHPVPAGWVRLGTWTYDAASPQTIQSFQMQIDLRDFEGAAYSNRIIVRAKQNWASDKVAYTCLYRVRVNGDIVN